MQELGTLVVGAGGVGAGGVGAGDVHASARDRQVVHAQAADTSVADRQIVGEHTVEAQAQWDSDLAFLQYQGNTGSLSLVRRASLTALSQGQAVFVPWEEAFEGIDLGHRLLHLSMGPRHESVIVGQEMQIWRIRNSGRNPEISQQPDARYQNLALRLGRARQWTRPRRLPRRSDG